MNDRHGLLTQPIGRVLLKMTLPNLIGALTILGFGIVDTFFISQLGTESLAAISFTFPVALIIVSLCIGIGAGVSTYLGRLIGSGQPDKAKVFLHDALLLTFLLTTLISTFGSILVEPIFSLLGANDSSLPLIKNYMLVWFLGAPMLTLLMVGNQALRATGDTKSPAKIMLYSSIINFVLDPLLIFGIGPFPRMEIQGAAIATVASWMVGLVFAINLLVFKSKVVDFPDVDMQRIKYNWQQLARIAQPAALMNLLNPVTNAILMGMLARMDQAAVAAFGAGTRLESILLMVVTGLSSSLMPFVAQNLGAGQHQRAQGALMLSIKFIFVFQMAMYLPLILLAEPIARIFSQDPTVIEWLSFYIMIMPAAYGPLGVIILVGTSLNAYHRPMYSLLLNICRLFLLMLPLAAIGAYYGGIKGLLIALPITNAIMGAVCYIVARQISEPLHIPQHN
ncbi:MATE family efflux transporter [Shewanella youngdeokensis]|uniref:MATE family efflux transporter n=1 Tax=Shewanella youngdeokensis TaxID=2999068 RepID=A0ABZ0JXZ8_9GAMM|nr:MATE family efflux transporter [Shewanella sp. DAU334]